MSVTNFNIKGLTQKEVQLSREKYGQNTLNFKKENSFLTSVKSLLKDPMIILLLAASSIYFISGAFDDGIFLSGAIVLIATISLYQESRSKNALDKLKEYAQPICKVIRDGKVEEIKSEEIVIGDSLMVEEGTTITADGTIVHSNDFSVNESILTGESLAVYKDPNSKISIIYKGTTVTSGLAIATVMAIGNATQLGKIGKSLETITEEQSPLEKQINSFVKKMVAVGSFIFGIVWAINYFQSFNVIESLLVALTLAMSILPEEIPVAFTTFMALGSWRLMKLGIVVKQMKTVETLGSATVICIDKTGTITENNMSLARLFVPSMKKISTFEINLNPEEKELVKLAMWASEPIPFDAMEAELHKTYAKEFSTDERPDYKMIHEYPLEGIPPMMTHIFENNLGNKIIATKGAPEAIMNVCELTSIEKQQIETAFNTLATEGFRVLGIGEATFEGTDFPKTQQEFKFNFKGLVAFHDPPKKNIQAVFEDFYAAGISVKIITGDNAETTAAIAKQVGFRGYEKSVSGNELMNFTHAELQKIVLSTNVFTRMFPEAKLKIINALKAENEIVAMTGDGVNDGPALKSAHIGVAMGKRGTEIAKQAASLILLEDDLSKMVDAVAMGRKIYSNLKKAIQYIISIHIPIILTVFIPLALGWVYPAIFSPVHIIFMELIMGPTCSIIYENEPMEKNAMLLPPRPFTLNFFKWKELATSIIQGLAITVGALFIYQYSVNQEFNETITRTMVFTVLIAANIFLTMVNRSFYYSIFTVMKYKNNLVVLIISVTVFLTGLLIYLPPLAKFFQFEKLNSIQLIISVITGFLTVIWYEAIKLRKRKTKSI
ncbi:MAG: cation-translocating P-type ATPase [Lutibacter sp.]|nr:cation-translocating P-type ATPase [Lutibacter sp.]